MLKGQTISKANYGLLNSAIRDLLTFSAEISSTFILFEPSTYSSFKTSNVLSVYSKNKNT